MAKYTVLPRRRQPGHKVELIDNDGSCRTLLGCSSEAEAEAWVQEDVRLDAFWQSLAGD